MPLDKPPIQVIEITSDRDKIVGADKPTTPDLGGRQNLDAAMVEDQLASIMSGVRKQQRRVFELKWEGNKVPRGAEVLGQTIAWTQNGIVTSDRGENIGTYERIEEFGGQSGKSQRMHVYVTSPKLLNADGK